MCPGTSLRPASPVGALFNLVTPGYFTALGIALRAGREFGEADGAGLRVAPWSVRRSLGVISPVAIRSE